MESAPMTILQNIGRRRQASFQSWLITARKSPEHKYPVPLQDCLDVLRWCSDQIHQLGGDERQLFVGGDSAGGNLAVASCLKARDDGWKGFSLGARALRGMILVYPCVSRKLVGELGGSYERFSRGFGLSRQTMAWFWEMYLGRAVEASLDAAVERYAAPLDAPGMDWSGLPPALTLFADHDVLYDDGAQLIERLRGAGIPVVSKTVPYPLHGSFSRREDPA
eukprot:CAMPEP_0115176902 /NCGR_PEP_ID=MMETSP0270-20121206/5106_1 /TAXON_ID=71861 /ORGANISM="Scrippsiella trochoidea, Strain CCMP3099" /LENGTH=221 /DNA_ID=CAMNT_0002589811 /DNA_START=13 /DNA_END=674 /DNA_ORIENTATION=+